MASGEWRVASGEWRVASGDGELWPVNPTSESEGREPVVREKRKTKRYRPKLPHCPLDTVCGKAPKVRRLCWWKIVGKGESRGHKTVQP